MIADAFAASFGGQPTVIQQTSGRVELLGSHTDYNGGMVLPAGLPVGVTVALRPTAEPEIRIGSQQFTGMHTYALGESARGHWADYAAGAVMQAQRHGLLSAGAELTISTTMPDGAGLSSSAALIVCVLKAARASSAKTMDDTQIALLAQAVEHDFIGVPVGIMDQMAVAITTASQAMALDTRTMHYELINVPSKIRISVIHSGYSRKLSDGRYKQRRDECDEAKRLLNVDHLCLLDHTQINMANALPWPYSGRAIHLAKEHIRTIEAIAALEQGDLDRFGALINASHASMRDLFQITTPQIDDLVGDAVALGAAGARLTGGGFGGCIVACTSQERFDPWIKTLLERQPKARLIC